jgi:hypothetical protein
MARQRGHRDVKGNPVESETMTGQEFMKRAKYFDFLIEIIDAAEEFLGARSLRAVYAYLLGYLFASVRSDFVEVGPDRLIPLLEEIVRPEGLSYLQWPESLIRQCGSEEAAYARFRELIAHEVERERNGL